MQIDISRFDSCRLLVVGDLMIDEYVWGNVDYFEPAAVTAPDDESNHRHLSLFSKYAVSDGGLLEDQLSLPEDQNIETSLVLLKPDEAHASGFRPGGKHAPKNLIGPFEVADVNEELHSYRLECTDRPDAPSRLPLLKDWVHSTRLIPFGEDYNLDDESEVMRLDEGYSALPENADDEEEQQNVGPSVPELGGRASGRR